MIETIDQWKAQLSVLSEQQRAELAYYLLSSLGPEEDGVGPAWDEEVSRRVGEIRSGKVSGRPAGQVFAELREAKQ